MSRIGFIGYGSMGSMLVNGFLRAGALQAASVFVSTRTKQKLTGLLQQWPGLNPAESNAQLATQCSVIFICVRPVEVRGVLNEIAEFCNGGTHIISIAGRVLIRHIKKTIPCKISRVIPSLTSEVNEGVSLVCHSEDVDSDSAIKIEKLLGTIGGVKRLREQDIEIASELTSCAPGLIAAIFSEFVESGLRHSSFTREEIEEMVMPTLFGTAKLMLKERMSFQETISRVATPGGITEEGVKVLNGGLPAVFDELFERSMAKRAMVGERIAREFDNQIL
jgi:pyrroline-5-carboxylate reductase